MAWKCSCHIERPDFLRRCSICGGTSPAEWCPTPLWWAVDWATADRLRSERARLLREEGMG